MFTAMVKKPKAEGKQVKEANLVNVQNKDKDLNHMQPPRVQVDYHIQRTKTPLKVQLESGTMVWVQSRSKKPPRVEIHEAKESTRMLWKFMSGGGDEVGVARDKENES